MSIVKSDKSFIIGDVVYVDNRNIVDFPLIIEVKKLYVISSLIKDNVYKAIKLCNKRHSFKITRDDLFYAFKLSKMYL